MEQSNWKKWEVGLGYVDFKNLVRSLSDILSNLYLKDYN